MGMKALVAMLSVVLLAGPVCLPTQGQTVICPKTPVLTGG
jgi:hypothetical protein